MSKYLDSFLMGVYYDDEVRMMVQKKRKVQVNIDADLAGNVNAVLEELGVNPTVLITALYKRVAATGEVPFKLSLTDREKANLAIREASQNRPVKFVNSASELDKLYDDDDEY